jgi:hypothetical protein
LKQTSYGSTGSANKDDSSCAGPGNANAMSAIDTLHDVENYIVYQLRKRFLNATKIVGKRKFLSYHITCACSAEDIKAVFGNIYEHVIKPKVKSKMNVHPLKAKSKRLKKLKSK